MSSPASASSVNNSRMATIEDGNKDAPATTPPTILSNTATPVSEIDMNEDNQENNTNVEQDTEKADEQKEEKEVEDEEEEGEEGGEEQLLSLPLSKIKRIFKLDPDYVAASQSAVYATGLATELFIQYFVEQASVLAKMEKRKKIQYKDFSNAVAGHDSLNFLGDSIPKTQPIGELIQKGKINLNKRDENRFASTLSNDYNIVSKEGNMEIDSEVGAGKRNMLPRGQQKLHFSTADHVGSKPITRAKIHNLVTNDDETEATSKEATEEVEDQDVVMVD